jgi:hypothetical protein
MPDNKTVSHTLLAAWLQEQYPDLFAELVQELSRRAGGQQLSGFTDILSSIGSAIGSAATTVWSGLSNTVQAVGGVLATKEGAGLLSSLAAIKLQSGANSILATQVARAGAGVAPAPIQTTYDPSTGTYVPTVTTASGQQVALTPQMLSSLQPSFIDKYGLWIAGGGAALLLGVVLLRR